MATIYYSTEELVKGIEKELARNTAILNAWKAVTYPTKKDGTPFNTLSKNIAGARIYRPGHCLLSGQNVVEVCLNVPGQGWITDDVYAYAMVEDLKDTDPRKAKTQNFMTKESPWLKQVYQYDVDDIKQAIQVKIEYLEMTISDKKKQIKAAKKAFETFKKDYETIRARLEKNTVFENGNKTLFYMILQSVQKDY